MAAFLVNMGGFDTGDYDQFDQGAASTATIEAVIITKFPWASTKYAKFPTGTEKILEAFALNDGDKRHVIGFWFLHTNDNISVTKVFSVYNGNGEHFHLKLDEKRFRLYDSGGTLRASSSQVVTEDTWHEINIAWKRGNAGVGYLIVDIDGTQRINEGTNGDYEASGGVSPHVPKWESNTESGSVYVDHYYHLHDGDENDFLTDFHVIGPFQNTSAHDWSSGGGVPTQAWVNCQENPRTSGAECEIPGVSGAYVGCSTGAGTRSGPRGTDAANAATAIGAKYMWDSALVGFSLNAHQLYGRQVSGSEGDENYTKDVAKFRGWSQFVQESVGVGTGCPDVDEWFQIGYQVESLKAYPDEPDCNLEWCACVMLVTGGSAPSGVKRITLGTIHKTAKEILAV